MTQEEKQLLLVDLSARLPHGIILHFDEKLDEDDQIFYGIRQNGGKYLINDAYYIEEVKPYLRPMESMTEEEKIEYRATQDIWQADYCAPDYIDSCDSYDWLDKKMFDYRGLIPMKLALEAKEGMYGKEAEK